MKNISKIILTLIIIAIISVIMGVLWYLIGQSPINKKNNDEIEITIPLGSGSSEIANILKENELIKNKTVFKIYVKLNKVEDFKAGKYFLKQSMNIREITEMLKTGIMYDPNQINITYLEGKNFRWFAKKIEETTNNSEEAVYELLNNEEYINSLIEKYWFLTDEIKSENVYYSLEGYLFPDTYTITNKDAKIEEIVEKMLDKMEEILNEYKQEIQSNKYSIHQILTIASIIEMESMSEEGRKDVSSVIYNRLENGMAIQSDVTTYYAFKVDMGERDLYQREIDEYNPYNTRGPNMEGRLPIGPISSVSKSSIEAALKPNSTDYLFFVADKNGKLYFSKTVGEHNQTISKLREDGLWLEY